MINPTLSEWLNLIFRWVHVFAGIMWVGTTYYFTWLDARLTEEEKAVANAGTAAQIWMVHSGGFYVVEKRKVPDLASRTLHWFRWEAGMTWLSGAALLILVYYIGGGALVDRDVCDISVGAAVGIGVGVLVAAWVVYDVMVRSALGRNEKLFAVVAYVLIVAVTYGLSRVFSGRAAYIQHRRDVWHHHGCQCLDAHLAGAASHDSGPNEGHKPDESLAAQAKLRSKQNTFMAVPVVFTMISNHFPGVTYGDRYNWLVLAILILVGCCG